MGIFSTAVSDEKWEADFRSQIDPQLAIGAAQIVVEVRDKSKKAAQKRLPEYIKVMADHGYKLTQTDMHRTGLTSSWGELTFVPEAPTPVADPAEQLKQLADLHASGLLTDEEFEAKRAALVDRL